MNWNKYCQCWHHWVPKVLQLLAWVSAVLFFWSSLKQVMVWGYDALYYAWVVIILMLLSFSSGGGCKCCGKAKDGEGANVCSHEGGCACGDCGRCK
mgnify:CR=1 FL=1